MLKRLKSRPDRLLINWKIVTSGPLIVDQPEREKTKTPKRS